MSAVLSNLEVELGFKLFDRVKGRLQPTTEAGYFYEYTQGLVSQFEGLGQVAKDIREANSGHIRIAANPAISLHLLPRVVSRFRQRHPRIELMVQTQSSHQVRESLHSQQFDIGIAELPILHQSVDMEEISYPCVCAIPEGHALTALDHVTPADLVDVPMVVTGREHTITSQLRKAFGEAGLELSVAVEAQLVQVACAIVAEGGGVAVVDTLTASHFGGRGVTVRPFFPEISLDLAVIFPRTRPRSIATKAFYGLLSEEVLAASGRVTRPQM